MTILPSDLNQGIVNTVAWLVQQGFHPVDSGDGQTHDYACDRDYPYVVLQVPPAELIAQADALARRLADVGIEVAPQLEEGKPHLQANYEPVDGLAFLDLQNVDDMRLGEALAKGKTP